MRNLSLWCLVVPWLVVETATDESQDMGQKFQAFQELTQKWFLPDEPPKARKKHLAAAFKVAKPLLKWMSTLDTFPPGLDPLTFAAKVISLRQKWQHAKMVPSFISLNVLCTKTHVAVCGSWLWKGKSEVLLDDVTMHHEHWRTNARQRHSTSVLHLSHNISTTHNRTRTDFSIPYADQMSDEWSRTNLKSSTPLRDLMIM